MNNTKKPASKAKENNRGGVDKFTPEQVAQAIVKANGLLADAARILKCSRTTLYAYIKKYKVVADAREEADETTKDMVEGKLIDQIKQGNITAIIFYLKTKAKDRGYIDRQEHSGPVGQPLQPPQQIEIVKN